MDWTDEVAAIIWEGERTERGRQYQQSLRAGIRALETSHGISENESRVNRAVQAVHEAVADFIIAVQQCRTTDDALRVSRSMESPLASLDAAQSAALNKADELSGASR